MGIRCTDHVTPLYPQKLALTSPTGGGRSVGIVRSRTEATEFLVFFNGFYSASLQFCSLETTLDQKILKNFLQALFFINVCTFFVILCVTFLVSDPRKRTDLRLLLKILKLCCNRYFPRLPYSIELNKNA